MQVLHVTPSYYPAFRYGGPIRSVHLLNRELVRQGVQVDVLTTTAGQDRPVPLRQWVPVGGVRVRYLPWCGYEHYTFSLHLLCDVVRRAPRYDLVHITAVWNFPVLAAGLACCWHRIPYVISPRGTLYAEAMALGATHWKRRYYRLVARHLLEGASCLHFTTVDEQRKVVSHLGLTPPGAVIPNGLDLGGFQALPPETALARRYPQLCGRQVVLFLGRLHRKKGLDLLAKAMGRLGDRPAWRLVIAGPDQGGHKREVEAWLRQAGVRDRALFTGPLRGRAKLEAYRGAQLFVLPSYSENFGMTVVEALACGTPVVITDRVGIYDDVARAGCGRVVPPDAAALAAAIEALLCAPEACRHLGARGQQLVRDRYDIRQVAARFHEVYEEQRGAG